MVRPNDYLCFLPRPLLLSSPSTVHPSLPLSLPFCLSFTLRSHPLSARGGRPGSGCPSALRRWTARETTGRTVPCRAPPRPPPLGSPGPPTGPGVAVAEIPTGLDGDEVHRQETPFGRIIVVVTLTVFLSVSLCRLSSFSRNLGTVQTIIVVSLSARSGGGFHKRGDTGPSRKVNGVY